MSLTTVAGVALGDTDPGAGVVERAVLHMNRPGFRSVLEVRMEHDEQEVLGGDA